MAGRPQAEREQRRALEIGAVLTGRPYRRTRPRALRLAACLSLDDPPAASAGTVGP